MASEPSSDGIRTTLYLRQRIHARLRQHAFNLNTSMSKLAERYFTEGIDADERAASSREPAARHSDSTRKDNPR